MQIDKRVCLFILSNKFGRSENQCRGYRVFIFFLIELNERKNKSRVIFIRNRP